MPISAAAPFALGKIQSVENQPIKTYQVYSIVIKLWRGNASVETSGMFTKEKTSAYNLSA